MSMLSMAEVSKVMLLLSNGETSILWSMLSSFRVLETSLCDRESVTSDFAKAASIRPRRDSGGGSRLRFGPSI